MRFCRLFCSIIVLAFFCSYGNAVTLVENHKAKSVIVVPAGTNPQVGPVDSVDTDVNLKHAPTSEEAVKQGLNNAFQWYTATTNSVAVGAMELQDYIQKATGAKLEIKTEDKLVKDESSLAKIFVGPCKDTLTFIDVSKIEPEGFVIKTKGNDVYVVGGDKTNVSSADGTLNGCYEFLKRYVGVRWLMPGEIGEVVPKASTLNVDNADIKFEPQLWERRIRDCHAHVEYGTIAKILKKWDSPMSEWEKFFDHNVTNAWFRRHGLGARVEIRAMHSNMGYWDKYHEKYPEIFAMQADGTRINTNVREMLCISNPTTWEVVAQEKFDEFKQYPTRTCASILPNDDGGNRFCMCEKCAAWDPPGSPKIYDANGRYAIELSDRYFHYFNEVSKLVAKQYPDRYLGVYAYEPYKDPPVTFNKVADNLFVGFVGFDTYFSDKELQRNMNLWMRWSKLAKRLYLRPNLLWNGLGLPANYTHKFANNMRMMADNGMLATDFDGLVGNWGGEGLDYYVAAEIVWNPHADVNAVIDDYCKAAYGKGADEMKAYYDRLEKLTNEIAAGGKYKDRFDTYYLVDYYTDDALDELQSHVDKALAAVGDSDKNAVERIKLVSTSLDYTKKLRHLVQVAHGAKLGKISEADYKKVRAETEKYFATLVTSWSIAMPHNYILIDDAIDPGVFPK
jgi:hypothetical protein